MQESASSERASDLSKRTRVKKERFDNSFLSWFAWASVRDCCVLIRVLDNQRRWSRAARTTRRTRACCWSSLRCSCSKYHQGRPTGVIGKRIANRRRERDRVYIGCVLLLLLLLSLSLSLSLSLTLCMFIYSL